MCRGLPRLLHPSTFALYICLVILSSSIQDSRCYLMNGGAVESFFISEDTPVGSVIGTLSVNGDPSEEQGDITLKLQEKGAAVGIAPGTKNLTLLRALDREEKKGPSNVYVNVRCDRRRTTDPSFIIPVSVRVWDVNDNAPAWVGAPYRVRLSELTAVGTRVLHGVRATDADQPGPHATIRYSVQPGRNSEYFGFANELDSVLVVKKPLDYETLKNFTITLRAEDQGTPPLHNDTTLEVEVLDADDQNPKFTHDHYTTVLPEDFKEGTVLKTAPGPIAAFDQDTGINAPIFYSTTGDDKHLVLINRDTGQVAASKQLADLDQPITIVIKATQVDNSDRYALATLSVSRARRAAELRAVRFAKRQFAASVSEAAPAGTVVATLHTDPPSRPDRNPLQFYVSDRSFLEKFAINNAGEVLLRKALDYEAADSYHYQVMVTDGHANDTASINITVLNVNEWEPRFRFPQYEFRVDDMGDGKGGLVPVGKLEVFDGDKPDTVALTLRGADASMFYMNESGDMFLRQEVLPTLNATVLHVVATAVDSGSPPRQTSVPVIVHLNERLVGGASEVHMSSVAVVALFAAALVLLALLVCALLAYIYRVRRSKPTSPKSPGFASHEKSAVAAPAQTPAAAPGLAPALEAAPSGSLLSVSAGASTILANSSSSLDIRDNNGFPNGQRAGEPDPRRDQPRGGRTHEPDGLLLNRNNSLPSRKYSMPTYGSLNRHTIKARHLKSIIYALPDSPEHANSRPTNGEPWVTTSKGIEPALPTLKTINEKGPSKSDPNRASLNKNHYSVVQRQNSVVNKEIVRATIESPSRRNSQRVVISPSKPIVSLSRENTSGNLKTGVKSNTISTEPITSNSDNDIKIDQSNNNESPQSPILSCKDELSAASTTSNIKQTKNLNNSVLKAKLNQNNIETINRIRENSNVEAVAKDSDTNKINHEQIKSNIITDTNENGSKTTSELTSKALKPTIDDVKALPGYINTHESYNDVMAEYTTKIIKVNRSIDNNTIPTLKSNTDVDKTPDRPKQASTDDEESPEKHDKSKADFPNEKRDRAKSLDSLNRGISNENLTDANNSTIVRIKIADDGSSDKQASSSASSYSDIPNLPILDPLAGRSYTTATIDPRKLRTRHLKPPTLPKRGFHMGQRYKRL
ncbi:hypothetical protein K1T71_003589 [Dendrolimus kikuchii]|uniref:Uncharacterized protein n=1 Tax=Dendrolimus kikuchii TaxID=765133 RepID=A0ACC1DC11_9NEOP|nr:hypothetical protein K1T71_003589 [Dendrolimus kikuchii]